MRWKRPLLGFIAGVLVGMSDLLLFEWLGVSMIVDGVDRSFEIVTFFALNFGGLGAVIGALIDSRIDIKARNEVIASQYTELEATQRALLEASTLAAVGQLSSQVAHEVRNPLGVIRASASMILEDLEPESDSAEAAEFIREEVDRLGDFVTRLLDFTRPLHIEPGEVAARDLLDRLDMMIAQETCAIELVAMSGLILHADEDLLLGLLLGLVQNAARAAGARGRVLVDITPDTIHVADDGPGIPPGDLERVFEPFYTTHPRGTGLGLAMARKIATAHGAALDARAGEGIGPDGRGARFVLTWRSSSERAGEAA